LRVQVFHSRDEFQLAITPLASEPDVNFSLLDRARALMTGWGEEPFMATVEEPDGVKGAAAGLNGHELILSRMDGPAARALAEELERRKLRPGQVFGPVEAATTCAGLLAERSGLRATTRHQLRLFRVDAPPPTPAVPGRCRIARDEDLSCLADWEVRLAEEAGTTAPTEPQRSMQAWLNFGGVHLWEHDGPAAMLMARRTLDRDITYVSSVFTPGARRGHGYATALVAEVTARHLRAGSLFCLLHARADQAAPLRLYARVGFRPCADFLDITLCS
jgi:GNAT superfamily N-acetyltransferase